MPHRYCKLSFALLRKYFSIVFLFAIFLSTTHHHNDLKLHNDCKICILQSNITNADTPPPTSYLVDITIISEQISTYFTLFYNQSFYSTLHSRAPPIFLF